MMHKEICETSMLQIDKFPRINEATNVHLWNNKCPFMVIIHWNHCDNAVEVEPHLFSES